MTRFFSRLAICFALGMAAASPVRMFAADDLDQLEQQAISAAVKAAEKSVVQIRTIGGVDQIDGKTLAQGPTTGVIISDDGLIVSSAFNFAQQPTSILVRLPDGEQKAARIIGRDENRMLVLLRVAADEPLTAAEPAPLDEVRTGDSAIALGRPFNPEDVSVSVGVVSALNRMFGRAIQTDANVSAANYGGPLIDLEGRVLGILAPMAPPSPGASEADVTAGAEFYDSGIGFAVPLVDVLAIVDRWTDEKDLHRGLLGIGLKAGNAHSTAPIITNVWPRSPAAIAGWKADDRIVSVNGVKVNTQTALRFQTMPRYAGDTLAVTLRRGSGDKAKEIETKIRLVAKLPPYAHPFLGVLPERAASASGEEADADGAADEKKDDVADAKTKKDDAAGVVIRSVWPDSPADDAGLRAGDRIVKLGDKNIASAGEARSELNAKAPDDELAVVAKRGDEEQEFEVKLGELPTAVLDAADLRADSERASDSGSLGDPKLQTLKLPEMSQTARYFQPPSGGATPGLLIWLGDGKRETAEAMAADWQRTCVRDRLTLLMPEPGDAGGWTNDDLEYLARLLQTAGSRWRIDPSRVVIAGEGKGGQLAYALALRGRKMIRGVAVVDSPLPRTLEVPENNPNERLAILSVETQNTPLSLLIRQDLKKLEDAGYPVTQLVRRGEESRSTTLDAATRAKIGRWIDGLDRL
ncbi:PDZ domain-containing protein [Lacipirellula sp.]|uniref:PDZ domain-containing protein n=1 Tax=Lacipirellula sp. TaxID=2691419 RepID=UPI003D11DF0A